MFSRILFFNFYDFCLHGIIYHTSCVFTVVFTVVFTASSLRVHSVITADWHIWLYATFQTVSLAAWSINAPPKKMKTKIAPEQRLGARPRHAAGHAQGARSSGHARLLHRSWRARAPAHRPPKQATNGRAADPKWRRAATFRKGQKSRTKSGADFWTEKCRCNFSLRLSSEILGPCRAWLGAAIPGPPRAHFWPASAGGGRGRARARAAVQ